MMKYAILLAAMVACFAYSAEAQKPYCSLCSTIVTYTEFIMEYTGETNATVIDDYLMDMCATLPSPIDTACDTVVTLYAEEIVTELVNDTPASQVCGNVGLCSTKPAPKKGGIIKLNKFTKN